MQDKNEKLVSNDTNLLVPENQGPTNNNQDNEYGNIDNNNIKENNNPDAEN